MSQADIILVHGYGMALDLDEPEIPDNGSFSAFDPEINAGKALPFVWAETMPRGAFTPYNASAQYTLYRREKASIFGSVLQHKLEDAIAESQPRVIIAHSLGCYLVRNLLVHCTIPESLTYVVFLQADIPRSVPIPHITGLDMVNFWCWWDTSLLSSVVVNQRIPIGLTGSTDPYVRNVFVPIDKHIRGHARLLANRAYKRRIYQEIDKL
jgi:hypothetical protein